MLWSQLAENGDLAMTRNRLAARSPPRRWSFFRPIHLVLTPVLLWERWPLGTISGLPILRRILCEAKLCWLTVGPLLKLGNLPPSYVVALRLQRFRLCACFREDVLQEL